MSEAQTLLLNGNHAVAWGARLARPGVIPVYPITPQTPILELITEFQARGEMHAQVLTAESEHSVLSACVPASLAGARVFTATASQGLLLMHEVLHYASGARAPIVLCNVNRTVASPWAFWPDETDSLSQRDTGWIQYYSESPQESLDTVLQAFRVAETVQLPVMISHDAFYVSHSLEAVQVPAQATADQYLAGCRPVRHLDTAAPAAWGNVVTAEMYYRHRQSVQQAMERALQEAQAADRVWGELTGRSYGVLERYRCEDARIVVVALGSVCGTARQAIDDLRSQGIAAGLLKLRLFRPLPQEALRVALGGVPDVLVLDRDHSPGLGGILQQEVRGALYGLERAPRVHGVLAGVGGVDVPPRRIAELVLGALANAPALASTWG